MEKPQPFKQFRRTIVPHGGQRVRGYAIECGACGVTATAAVNNFSNFDKEEAFVVNKFKALAWKVGNNKTQNRCPGCFAKIRTAAAKKTQENNVVQLVTTPAIEPRQMTREDRRIIFDKLSEVYQDEKVGYRENWTDATVAKDLGVPRAWVQTMRDENFGPEGSNSQISAAVEQAEGLLSQIKTEGAKAETVVMILRGLVSKAEQVEKMLSQIRESLR